MQKNNSCIFSFFFLISCSNIAEKSQNQTQILIEYALYDFPLPEDSEIQMDMDRQRSTSAFQL